MKPDIGSELQFLFTPAAFNAQVMGFSSEYCHGVWYWKKPEWCGYPKVKKF